jgi:hypothetical protein
MISTSKAESSAFNRRHFVSFCVVDLEHSASFADRLQEFLNLFVDVRRLADEKLVEADGLDRTLPAHIVPRRRFDLIQNGIDKVEIGYAVIYPIDVAHIVNHWMRCFIEPTLLAGFKAAIVTEAKATENRRGGVLEFVGSVIGIAA